jgi:hypothetical protein
MTAEDALAWLRARNARVRFMSNGKVEVFVNNSTRRRATLEEAIAAHGGPATEPPPLPPPESMTREQLVAEVRRLRVVDLAREKVDRAVGLAADLLRLRGWLTKIAEDSPARPAVTSAGTGITDI